MRSSLTFVSPLPKILVSSNSHVVHEFFMTQSISHGRAASQAAVCSCALDICSQSFCCLSFGVLPIRKYKCIERNYMKNGIEESTIHCALALTCWDELKKDSVLEMWAPDAETKVLESQCWYQNMMKRVVVAIVVFAIIWFKLIKLDWVP